MKSFPFAALLVAVLLASTAASPEPAQKWTMKLRGLGGFVASSGSQHNGRCRNDYGGYQCTMAHDETADLAFKTRADVACWVLVKRLREGRWDVFVIHGPCKILKLNDDDYAVTARI